MKRKLTLFINNERREFLVGPGDTLASVIREQAGLKGTRIGCEQGSCGACTVLSDGKPLLSCITPALRHDGARITTIEGIRNEGKLHRLQEKMVEHGAIQCGFCTPGMVMTALEFTEKNPNATAGEIREALSGNLCRCTGYKKIIDAVLDSLAPGKQDQKSEKNGSLIGGDHPYIESEKKVSGSALYADDIELPGTLHCAFLRSTVPHAKLQEIDLSDALKAEGVKIILTGKDIPEPFGVLPISQDETAMAVDKVRYAGEIMAAVAAETREQAIHACNLIKVDYLPLKNFLNIDDSVADAGSNEKIHSHTKFNNNIHKKAELRFGDQAAGFAGSAYRSKMSFAFEGVNHGFTEPHAAIAVWDSDGLTITTATQVPHYLHRAISKVLKLPLSRVRVIKPYVGGGFGGKSDPFPHELIISMMAMKTGRPVKVRLSREEVFLTNHGRHPSDMTLELGADKNGKFKVLDADIRIDGGAYGSFGVVTSYYNGVLLQAPYQLDHFGFRTIRVYTNKPQCGAMRGHGAVNSRFAVESLVDDLAFQMGADPIELRLKNFMPANSLTLGQYRITSNGSREALTKVAEASGWKSKFGKLPRGKGIGAGCGFFISGSALPIIRNELPQSVVHLKLDFDGRVVVSSGASDIGQGSDTMLAIVAAETLGISLDRIYISAADTLLTPVDLGSYSSRVTFMAGNAAKMAAEKLRNKITEALSKRMNKDLNPEYAGNRIRDPHAGLDISWEEGVNVVTAGQGAVTCSGHYVSPKLGGDFKGAGAGLSPSYSFGAVVAEVDVNLHTGQVVITKIWGAHDCGKALNRMAVEGQLEGSWHMGIGQVLSEEMRYFEGLIFNSNFLDYKIPTSMDTPDMDTNIIESFDPEGPFGAKECGEGALHPVIPAVVNAVFNATGVRITRLPMRPEDILEGLKKTKTVKHAL